MATTMDISKMKIADLKKELKERGLTTTGNKGDLQERLRANIAVLEANDADLLADVSAEVDDDDINDDDEILDDQEISTDALMTDDVLENLEATLGETVMKPTQKQATAVKKQVSPLKSSTPNSRDEDSKPEEVKDVVPPAKGSVATDEDKLMARAKKYGAQSEISKKQLRVARFGGSATTTDDSEEPVSVTSPTAVVSSVKADDVDQLKKRAERFGLVSPKLTQLEELSRKQKRQQRFGTGSETTADVLHDKKNQKLDDDTKVEKRKERFSAESITASTNEEAGDRKRKRAARFGLVNAPGSENVVQSSGLINMPGKVEVDDKKRKRLERFGLA